uniref:MSP domain-containing protein n=1 Tax=Alexandrium catenella TaxID=2925 RepID=A0A7S1RFB4_ALECA|mmetsp:Transcript_54235/g.145200  ORF Transcript_54235/g.145200 Transcript_54235/m.145200 type:complete len:241 (+) Transcript_54235:76-798(+)
MAALLQLNPDTTLHFTKGPNTTSPSRTLKLTNLHSTSVAFKVKTTAPKAYLVRPSSGTLRPREDQEVQIILQPTETQANNHRFLVQAIPVASSEPVSREQWAELPKEKVQEQRLNVVLEEVAAVQPDNAEPSMPPTESAMSNNTLGPAPVTAAAPSPKDAGPSAVSTKAPEQPADLKVKYEELVQYTLLLEKEKKKLEADMAGLQCQKGAPAAEGCYTKVHVVLVALLAFLLSYVATYLS